MAKQIRQYTRRTYLLPMSMDELDRKVLFMEDGELRDAYQEMLTHCRRFPEDFLYYTPWKICLKENGVSIGDVCFKGPPQKGVVEIGYGLEPEFEGNGYMTEAAGAMVEWAFSQKGVTAVEAETAPENHASQRILEKLGFHPSGTGEEGPRFVRKRSNGVLELFVKFTHVLHL